MPDSGRLGGFFAATLVLLVVPGPAVLYIVARGIDQGRRAGLVSVGGVATGNLVQAVTAALGLTAVLATSAAAFTAVKMLGAAYLVFLGVRRLLGRDETAQESTGEPRGLRRVFAQGVAVATLNPKTALFFLAFLPQCVSTHGDSTSQILVLGVIFVFLGLCTDACYALAAGTVGRALVHHRGFTTTRRYLTGTVYVALGAAAAFTGRVRD